MQLGNLGVLQLQDHGFEDQVFCQLQCFVLLFNLIEFLCECMLCKGTVLVLPADRVLAIEFKSFFVTHLVRPQTRNRRYDVFLTVLDGFGDLLHVANDVVELPVLWVERRL